MNERQIGSPIGFISNVQVHEEVLKSTNAASQTKSSVNIKTESADKLLTENTTGDNKFHNATFKINSNRAAALIIFIVDEEQRSDRVNMMIQIGEYICLFCCLKSVSWIISFCSK